MHQKFGGSKIVDTVRSVREGVVNGSTLSPGTMVGGYAVVRAIGMGGLGVVYEARHQRLDKPVAIKALQSELLSDPHAIERFLREGRTAAKLRHPNVVDVSDVTLDGDTPYLVMELLQGEDLASTIAREGCLSVATTVDLLEPIVSALMLAHERGIVHRDLKPRNIFLNRSTLGTVTPKIVDFGISKVIDESVIDLTRSNDFVGTPHYTSPEQARGDKHIDHCCDQFSLGVIAYECLTGMRPFKGDSLFTVLSAVVNHEPPAVNVLKPNVPAELAAVIMKLMAKAPANRFENMTAVGRALLPFASSRIQLAYDEEFSSAANTCCAATPESGSVRGVLPRLSSTARLDGPKSERRSLDRTVTSPLGGVKALRRSVKLGAVALGATLGLAGVVSSRPLVRETIASVRKPTVGSQVSRLALVRHPVEGQAFTTQITPNPRNVVVREPETAAKTSGLPANTPRQSNAKVEPVTRHLGRSSGLGKAAGDSYRTPTIPLAPTGTAGEQKVLPLVDNTRPQRGVNGALILP